MAQQRATRASDRRGRETGSARPLRRASDPTLLMGPARLLTQGAVVAVVLGVLLALLAPPMVAPVSFTLSSIVAIGLLGAARRADTDARPDHLPDRSPRTYRVMALVVLLAVIGTGISAWTIAADLAR